MTTSKQRRWLLIKALESGASLKDALELSKQADDFLNLKQGDEQQEDVLVPPLSQANGRLHGGLISEIKR